MNSTGARTTAKSLIGHYAGFVSRTLAFMIDILVISVSAIAANWFVEATSNIMQFKTLLVFSSNAFPALENFVGQIAGITANGLLFFLYVIGYHVFFWAFAGQTPGKALIGLRVVSFQGGKLSAGRALLRFLGYFISTIPVWLGFLWIIIDDRRQAWHDKLSGTCVIYTWEARPDEHFLADEIVEVSNREPAN